MKKEKVAEINEEMSQLINYYKTGELPKCIYGDGYYIEDEFTIKEIYDDLLKKLFKEV